MNRGRKPDLRDFARQLRLYAERGAHIQPETAIEMADLLGQLGGSEDPGLALGTKRRRGRQRQFDPGEVCMIIDDSMDRGLSAFESYSSAAEQLGISEERARRVYEDRQALRKRASRIWAQLRQAAPMVAIAARDFTARQSIELVLESRGTDADLTGEVLRQIPRGFGENRRLMFDPEFTSMEPGQMKALAAILAELAAQTAE